MKRTLQASVLGALMIGMLVLPVTAATAADSPQNDDGNLSVTIADTSNPGQGNGSTGGSNSGGSNSGGSHSGGSGSTGGNTGTPTGSTGGTGGSAGEVSVAGMLYVGGLNSSVAISPNPGEGVVTLWFTVRNASKSTVDGRADFWMNSQVFGNRIDGADGIAVTGLLPGESRVVKAELHYAGQWTLLDAHVRFTPPETVDGTALTPVTRDAVVLVFPWLVTASIALVVIGFFVFRALRAAFFMPAIAGTA
jgi:hypothetical protein